MIQSLDHVAIAVRDVSASAAWYADVLGLTRVLGDVPTLMAAGNDTMIALFPVNGDDPKPRPGKDAYAMLHFAFRTDRAGFKDAQVHLRKRSIKFRRENFSICHSIFFYDPDGHEIEITTYDL
ncbi:MAG: VOC family protein [Planctomycetes bacterium]|nr:VOC family protein [Planctomycetota bacterium]